MLKIRLFVIRNWLGLMKGNLKTNLKKMENYLRENLIQIEVIFQKMAKGLKLHGRSLLLIRNVGHLMTNPR